MKQWFVMWNTNQMFSLNVSVSDGSWRVVKDLCAHLRAGSRVRLGAHVEVRGLLGGRICLELGRPSRDRHNLKVCGYFLHVPN